MKDLSVIPKNERDSIEVFAFESLIKHESISEIGKIEKLRGYQNFYKVRFGNYRLGLRLEGETLVLERVLT